MGCAFRHWQAPPNLTAAAADADPEADNPSTRHLAPLDTPWARAVAPVALFSVISPPLMQSIKHVESNGSLVTVC
jgi:hypothetical protein